jgi:hypothetical protein
MTVTSFSSRQDQYKCHMWLVYGLIKHSNMPAWFLDRESKSKQKNSTRILIFQKLKRTMKKLFHFLRFRFFGGRNKKGTMNF